MKIVINTDAPTTLLKHIKETIKDKDRTEFKTWNIVKSTEGVEFLIHSTPNKQWENVLLRSAESAANKTVTFTTTTWTKSTITEEQSAYVIGRFVEQLMAHVRDSFDDLVIS